MWARTPAAPLVELIKLSSLKNFPVISYAGTVAHEMAVHFRCVAIKRQVAAAKNLVMRRKNVFAQKFPQVAENHVQVAAAPEIVARKQFLKKKSRTPA